MRYLALRKEGDADRVAMDLGYGDALLGTLYRWSKRARDHILDERITLLRMHMWRQERF